MSFKAEVTFIYFFHNGWKWLKISHKCLIWDEIIYICNFNFLSLFLLEHDAMAFVQNETFLRFSHLVLIYPLFRVRSVRIQFSVKLPSHLCCWHSSTRMIFGGWENHCVTANKSLFPRLFYTLQHSFEVSEWRSSKNRDSNILSPTLPQFLLSLIN